MKIANILEVEKDCIELLKRIEELKQSESNGYRFKEEIQTTYTSKETASVKRKSMDLTRSLSKMRNNIWD